MDKLATEAIQLNNNAVTLLRLGRHLTAHETLREALRVLQRMVVVPRAACLDKPTNHSTQKQSHVELCSKKSADSEERAMSANVKQGRDPEGDSSPMPMPIPAPKLTPTPLPFPRASVEVLPEPYKNEKSEKDLLTEPSSVNEDSDPRPSPCKRFRNQDGNPKATANITDFDERHLLMQLPTITSISLSNDDCHQANDGPTHSSSSNDDMVILFDRALLIDVNDEVKFSESNINTKKDIDHHDATVVGQCDALHDAVMAIALYNWGLVTHIAGIKRGVSSPLSKALRLYQLAMELLITIPSSQRNPKSLPQVLSYDGGPVTLPLLLFALLNNMAHIHAQFSDWDQMKFSLRQLLLTLAANEEDQHEQAITASTVSTTASTPTFHSCSTTAYILSEKDFAIFYANAVFFQDNDYSKAPAA